MKKKLIFISLAMLLVIAAAVGTTFAFLTDTDSVRNTFTVGKVMIALEEKTGENYLMVPGCEIEKDPTVTVKKGSEKCWVFVKVEESANPNVEDFITFDIDESWTPLMNGEEKVPNVYYMVAEKSDEADQQFPVLKENKVTVKEEITKSDMANIADDKPKPTLSFSAYACQYAGFHDDAKPEAENTLAAWNLVNPENK